MTCREDVAQLRFNRLIVLIPAWQPEEQLALLVAALTAVRFGKCAQDSVAPRLMQFCMQAVSGDRSIIAMIGGTTDTSGNNSYVFGLNFPNNTGPGLPYPPPPGYYQTASGNTIAYQVYWPTGGTLFCANLSSAYANVQQPLTVILRQL
jgi:hypothetical protein